jgi:hypothetical protein
MVKASAITNLVMIVSYVAGGGPNAGRLIVSARRKFGWT